MLSFFCPSPPNKSYKQNSYLSDLKIVEGWEIGDIHQQIHLNSLYSLKWTHKTLVSYQDCYKYKISDILYVLNLKWWLLHNSITIPCLSEVFLNFYNFVWFHEFWELLLWAMSFSIQYHLTLRLTILDP